MDVLGRDQVKVRLSLYGEGMFLLNDPEVDAMAVFVKSRYDDDLVTN